MTLSTTLLQEEVARNAKVVTFVIAEADKTEWPQDLIDQIGDRPAISITVMIDGKTYVGSDFDTLVQIEIPYTLSAVEAEKPNHLVIWSINEAGEAVVILNGKYDSTAKSVRFEANHSGSYAVVFVNKTFADLGNHSWARNAIEALAAREIIQGMGADIFGPAMNITRADFVVMLARALELQSILDAGDTEHSNKEDFDDVFSNDYYYEAITMAKQLNLVEGTGSNDFRPKDEISRQDMFTIVARALTNLGKLQIKGDMEQLSKFNDRWNVAEYAVGSVAGLVKEGLIEGDGHSLHPEANATRAEVAVFMERLMNLIY